MSTAGVPRGKSRGKDPKEENRPTGSMTGDAKNMKKSKPSDRLNPKTVDPFKDYKKPKSAFESVYVSGGLPCRLVHGSVKHKLQWDTNPEELWFDPLLVTLAEGLKEYKHPYQFVAQQGFKELLEVEDADVKTLPVLGRIVTPLRTALASKTQSVYEGALTALTQLSSAVGPHLCPHLKSFLSYLSRGLMDKRYKEQIHATLQHLELTCGKESLPIIKGKIPTYSSVIT